MDILLLHDISWSKDKIALAGSAMCACVQKYNPLINLFNNYPENERVKRYFNEYYANSDIDVMFLTNDILDFMDKIKTFYNQIVLNVCNNNTQQSSS